MSKTDLHPTYVALRRGLLPAIESHRLVKALDALDATQQIAAIEDEMVAAFRSWLPRVKNATDFCAVRFYWAGADVAPFVPQEVWSTGYAGDAYDGMSTAPRAALFREAAGFEPRPLAMLADAADEQGEEMPDDLFDPLKKLFVASSLAWASSALSKAMLRPELAALRPVSPFHFLATPGHDEETIVLGVWQRT